MDGARFDALAKALAAPSRRNLFQLLVGALLVPVGLHRRDARAAGDCIVGGAPCDPVILCCSGTCGPNQTCLLDPGQQCQTDGQCGTNQCEVVDTTTVVIPGNPGAKAKKKKKKKGKKGKKGKKRKGSNGGTPDTTTTVDVRECFCNDGRRACSGSCCALDFECAFPPNQQPTCLSITNREPGEFCTADAQCEFNQCANGTCRCVDGREPCNGKCCANGATCEEEGLSGALQCRCNAGTADERAQCGEFCCPPQFPTCNGSNQCCSTLVGSCLPPP
jgi:hypothetical protein